MTSVLHSTEAAPHTAATARQTGAAGSGSPDLMTSDDIPAVRAIIEGTASSTGEEFFQNLVRHLAVAIDVHYAFVAEFAEVNSRVRTLAYWSRDHIHDNVEWELAGPPCEDVVRGPLAHHPTGVKERFPHDEPIVALGIEIYLGVPLRDPAGNHLGHLAVFDERPLPSEPRKLLMFRIFAARAAAELERRRLLRTLSESEQPYRDPFEEAPIPHLHEDLQPPFITATPPPL